MTKLTLADTGARLLRQQLDLCRVVQVARVPFVTQPVPTLPGLAELESLGELPRDSDLYGFTRTHLVRERNRLEDHLEQAIAEARELERVLSASSR